MVRLKRLGQPYFVVNTILPRLKKGGITVSIFAICGDAVSHSNGTYRFLHAAIIRETFVAKNRQEAVEKARPCLEQLYRSIYIKWKQNEAMSDPNELTWAFDRLAKNRFILGSPEACIDQIKEYESRLGTNYMLVRFDWTPGLPQEEILTSMRLFGEKVIQKL